MTPKSTKEKGRRFVRRLLEIVRRELDPQAYEVKGSGQGLDKGDITAPQFDLSIEVKNEARINMATWLGDAKRGAMHRKWLLVWRNPATPEANPEILATLDFHEFLRIMKADRSMEMLSSREVKFHFGRAVEHLKRVIRLEP